ncbi:hypothetical protein B5X24_HaOG207039 [Helicoverpa armigera]|uniref:Uncharacterized protein n=1 Tax=Helicoverpa armigera TaxID=29058 RepID=A0A2W1BIL8_HELAM|nr:hypothetical protein B5X24_HaOG207039 [Helicoverpa armigera]
MGCYCVFVIVFCVFIISADCKNLFGHGDGPSDDFSRHEKTAPREKPRRNVITIPTYGIYLIGFTMLLMLLAIIGLSVALYLLRNNKQLFGPNVNSKQYVRQESTGVVPLYNSNYDDNNKNNGSTLTVNSGVIEISESRISEPDTPVRIEETKITFTKKPINPIVPVMPRGQMDAICKEVLKRVQKTDSASFRDLNELLNIKNEEKSEDKCDVVEESPKEVKEEENIESKIKTFEKIEAQKPKLEMEIVTKPEPEKESKIEIDKDAKAEKESKPTNEIENKLQPEEKNDVPIEIPRVEIDKSADVSDSETEYDTVPSPIPYRHSGPDVEMDDGFQLYDLPPRRSHEGVLKNLIQMDQDSHYLLALSTEGLDACYVNAKTPKLN